MRVFSATDIGKRDNQEDAYYVSEDNFFVVSDGMGGHAAGELASKAVIDSFISMEKTFQHSGHFVEAINEANRVCLDANDNRGATCTAVYVEQVGEKFICDYAHVGDSRLYQLRDKDLIKRISTDHGFGYRLTNCVGLEGMEIEQKRFEANKGDILVLCTDGISDVVSESEMLHICNESNHPAKGLIRKALDNDASDNCTVIVIKL